jgi:hypothetical protein
MIPFDSAINKEEILDFAFSHICSVESWEVHPIAERIVMWYIMNELTAKGGDPDDVRTIHDRYQDLMTEHLMCKLCKDGFVDATIDQNGNIIYEVSQAGKDRINK